MDGDSGDYPSVEELKALRVVDLRQKLSKAGLAQGGVKADLVIRLTEHYSKEKESLRKDDQPHEEEKEEEAQEEGEEYGEREAEEMMEKEEDSKEEEMMDQGVEEKEEEKEEEVEVNKEEEIEEEEVGEKDEEPGMEETREDEASKVEEVDKKKDGEGGSRTFLSGRLPEFRAGPLQQPPSTEDASVLEEKTNAEDVKRNKESFGQVKFPEALEEALALKEGRAESQDEFLPSKDEEKKEEEEQDEEEEEKPQLLKNQIQDDKELKLKGQKKKKKKKRRNRPEEWAKQAALEIQRREASEREEPPVEIEYVHEKVDEDILSDPKYRAFTKVFEAFKIIGKEEDEKNNEERERELQRKLRDEFKKVPKLLEEDDLIEENDDDDDTPKLSKRKLKKLNRLSVAELKQLVNRPDVVEMHDVTAWDPRLLVHLKSTRNSVPVPRHWCFKRKYLQGKRGIEKPPFDLPDFIKKTGIMEMRAALQEKEESKGLKSKMREKVRPKLGKIDIDYQKLHDAFFKWQTKPRMTGHGDLYYEGKEFEIRLKEKKPGDLSDDLRTALGMPVGPNAHKVPPPWLIAMQRYGPPPSYPNLKIPGLNAPIPESCSFGYHAGGWGKPPVDEMGKPLYGDVFGTSDTAYSASIPTEEIDRSLWGEMESESEEEEEESDDEEGDEAAEGEESLQNKSGMQTPIVDAGLATPSGMSSVGLAGQETPELLELRKKRIEADMESSETPNLYTVLPEKRNDKIGSSMMGSTHTYDLTGQGVKATTGKGPLDTAPVELALNPEEVDLMDTEAMQLRAEAAIREQQASLAKEDLSDMVAEHAAKQSNKRKRLAAKDEGSKSSKKYKEFKF